ncbi:tripartite tricarboxylate transporter TctB family protein [Brachyspira catarrhinii]|uniref:Tripartite tricarboxylate transporter TctB family protein n=1 Tax=Brachyspira catarrhinii TaxID=2528966 RepID=A0ABY2TS94_9SPIR|nr:tripartite tricarboxylate transporter TctB family protein [Brachyspira catarrhinii]TKZ35747.1 tripartite tricarboxylate transporter TctB family protein [Brachyspira catarrhinii]
MTINLVSSIITIAVGLTYMIMAFNFPDATVGRPMEPKIFPIMLGIALTILGLALLIQELMKIQKNKDKETIKLSFGNNGKKIAITVVNAIVYAILFNILGFVLSTIIFLEVELLIFGGLKSWKVSTIVSVLFSVIAFIIFNTLLGLYLPKLGQYF